MLLALFLACRPAADPGDSGACAPLELERGQSFDASALLPPGTDPESHPYEQGPGVVIGDYDGDGWLDLFVASGVGGSQLLRNGGGFFSAWEEPGELPAANGAGAADLDGDGDLDLVLGRARGLPDLWLENTGGRFVSHILPNSPGESMAPAFGDADGDGDLDIFLPGFVDGVALPLVERGEQVGDGHLLLLNQGGGVFADASDRLPAAVHDALCYQASFFDADGDGDQDLYLANDFGRYIEPNRLLLQEDGRFVEPGACFCEFAMNGMGVGVGDVNGDPYPDLFVAGWGGNALLVNDGRLGYIESAAALGAVPESPDAVVAWGGVFVDPDRDGDQDIAWANGPVFLPPEGESNPFGIGDTPPEQPDTLALNSAGRYADQAGALGFGSTGHGRSVAVGDLDGDGRPDLVVSGRVYLDIYYSRGGCEQGLGLSLDGGPGNRQGLGARVELEVAGTTRSLWMQPAASFGASAPVVYAGLGAAEAAEVVRVVWPGGEVQEWEDLPAGGYTLAR